MSKAESSAGVPADVSALLRLMQDPAIQLGQLPTAFVRITELACQHLSVDRASVWLWSDRDPSCLVCQDVCTGTEHHQGARLNAESRPLYFAHLWHSRLLTCDDLQAVQGCADHWCEWQDIYADQVRSALHVALVDEDQMVGMLCLENTQPRVWQEHERTFMLLLADQMVHALQQVERHRSSEQLLLAARVFDVSRDAIVVMDATGVVLQVNPAFSSITGFDAEDIVGRFYPDWVNEGGQTEVDFSQICPLVKDGSHWQGELMQRRKAGRAQAVWQTMLGVHNDQGQISHYIAIETDMSAYKEAQARVHYLSHYDALTGLANRLQMEETLTHQVEVASSHEGVVGVFCLDVDGFKKINLSLGHTLGDQLLGVLAQRLQRISLEHGLWSRLSADEFVFTCPLRDEEAAQLVADQILLRLGEPFSLAGQKIRLTASMGISLYPRDAMDAESLLRDAQSAMRVAKQSGGNSLRYYTPKMNARAVEQLLLENQLAQAVALGQLVLHYQPQVSLSTGQLVGIEALVRWQHPELGLVGPGQFIPLAEETHLIDDIGQWVLREACRQNAQWRAMGLEVVPVAVNVAASQFARQSIRDRVAQVLAQTELPAHLLELELTERIVMHDPAHVRDTLDALAELGVLLSLDDFGTGYSSLSYLQKFPLDKLKIDMSFVRNIANSRDDLAIARAIIQLGQTMELTVIAEGVETQEQTGLLRQVGCQEGQGYYYAKPLTAESMERLLRKRPCPACWPLPDGF